MNNCRIKFNGGNPVWVDNDTDVIIGPVQDSDLKNDT